MVESLEKMLHDSESKYQVSKNNKFARISKTIAVITVEPAVKYYFVFKSVQTRLMGQYNARLACVHPPPPLKKIVLSLRFFLEGEMTDVTQAMQD